MNSKGRKQAVLISDEFYTDPKTGVEVMNSLCFAVWADAGLKQDFQTVEGVSWVFQDPHEKTKYSIYIDQRYDRDFIKREIKGIAISKDAES